MILISWSTPLEPWDTSLQNLLFAGGFNPDRAKRCLEWAEDQLE